MYEGLLKAHIKLLKDLAAAFLEQASEFQKAVEKLEKIMELAEEDPSGTCYRGLALTASQFRAILKNSVVLETILQELQNIRDQAMRIVEKTPKN